MWMAGTSLLHRMLVSSVPLNSKKLLECLSNPPPYSDPCPMDKDVLGLWLGLGEKCAECKTLGPPSGSTHRASHDQFNHEHKLP